jgi:hypothetical protein
MKLSRPIVIGENPADHIFVDLDVERQGDLLCDTRTAPVGIALLHFEDRMNEFCARTFGVKLLLAGGSGEPTQLRR